LLEEVDQVGRRAALLAGAVEGYAGASVSLRLDGRMADDSCEDQRRRVDGQIAVPDLGDDCRICGAVLRDRGEGGSGVRWGCRMRHSRAVMCAVASAAGGKIDVGIGGEGEHRRDQRKAEDEEQDRTEKTPHRVIVASFAALVCQDLVESLKKLNTDFQG
jgi:hypothetical protein